MKFKVGDLVVVKDPTPYLDNTYRTEGLPFNRNGMQRFVNSLFVISQTHKEEAWLNEHEYTLRHLEVFDDYDVGQYVWHESWLRRAGINIPNEEIEDIDIENTIDFNRLI